MSRDRGTEQDHGPILYDFSALLELNISKTKEMVIDFRGKPPRTDPVVNHGEENRVEKKPAKTQPDHHILGLLTG
ncbi:hypothetical protein AAFF_G00009530 [Aldrovandia affinis]|uniref:Uncharacterized protein n=1 Tax=Aldrovandia affinis TaxID=143900 RepID=A0AAD7S6Z1_9TELE|nr:hypothetical protein AAFF_G00009530 [Aldrovandia affinis]